MASYDVRYETLQKSIKEEKKHAKEIEKEKEYMQSDEYIAQVAREKLGLVKDNEIVFEEEDQHFGKKCFFFLSDIWHVENENKQRREKK